MSRGDVRADAEPAVTVKLPGEFDARLRHDTARRIEEILRGMTAVIA